MDIFEKRSASPMLIHGESEPFDSEEYVYELKMDGERCLAYLDKTGTDLINRRDRRVLPNFPELAAIHKQAKKRCILDGELIVGVGSKQDFELIKQRALVKNPYTIRTLSAQNPATFVATDILYVDDRQLTHLPLEERKTLLRKTVSDSERLVVVHTIDSFGVKFYQLVKDKGLEGVIAKKKSSVYRMGKRTYEWSKFKNWENANFVVCGYLPSDRANVVSLVLGQYNEDGEMIYKGRVTLGVKRMEFAEVDKQKRAKGHPFSQVPPEASKGAVWLQPRLVCKAGFMCYTVNLRLRQPFFIELMPGVSPKSVKELTALEVCS